MSILQVHTNACYLTSTHYDTEKLRANLEAKVEEEKAATDRKSRTQTATTASATASETSTDSSGNATASLRYATFESSNALVVNGCDIEVTRGLKQAFLDALKHAAMCVSFSHGGDEHDMGIYMNLQYMVVLWREPESQTCFEEILLDNVQLPNSFARFIVQIPCEYSSGPHGTVATCVNGEHKTFDLGERSDEHFEYVYGANECIMRVHAPREGCSAFLLYDVSSVTPVKDIPFDTSAEYNDHANSTEAPQRADSTDQTDFPARCTAGQSLRQAVNSWKADDSCEKLLLLLEENDVYRFRKNEGFRFDKYASAADKAIVASLMDCRELEIGFAGGCMSM
jgi:hypothetical protein